MRHSFAFFEHLIVGPSMAIEYIADRKHIPWDIQNQVGQLPVEVILSLVINSCELQDEHESSSQVAHLEEDKLEEDRFALVLNSLLFGQAFHRCVHLVERPEVGEWQDRVGDNH